MANKKKFNWKTILNKISIIFYTILCLVVVFLFYQFALIAQNDIDIWKFFCGIMAGAAIVYPLTLKNQ